MTRAASAYFLDVRGLSCPLPVLKAHRTLRDLPEDAELTVLASDRAALKDFPAWCRSTGNRLLDCGETPDGLTFRIGKRTGPPPSG